MRQAIQGGGKIPVDASGNVPVAVGNQQINPVENVLYYEDLTVDLDQAVNTELFVIPDTMMYSAMFISLENTGGTTGDIRVHCDLSQDQSGEYAPQFMNFRNYNTDGTSAGVISHNNAGYNGHVFATALSIRVGAQGTGETGAVRIWLRGQSSFGT